MTGVEQAPRWALVLGSAGICFGAVGLLGAAENLAWPYLVEIQKHAADRVGASLQWPVLEDAGAGIAAGGWLDRPDWYAAYARAMAVARGVLALWLILASVWLLQARRGADWIFMSATAASALRNLVAAGAGLAAGSVFSFWALASGIFGFLLDTGLGAICLFSNRTVYRRR